MVPDRTIISDDATVQENIDNLKEENEKLREAFEILKELHQAKVKECNALAQEKDRLCKYPVLVACMVGVK